jgi:hypothetical protein
VVFKIRTTPDQEPTKETIMSLQITVRLPIAPTTSIKARTIAALDSCTSKSFSVQFVEDQWGRTDVECHNKGVGLKTLCRWTAAVRKALNQA